MTVVWRKQIPTRFQKIVDPVYEIDSLPVWQYLSSHEKFYRAPTLLECCMGLDIGSVECVSILHGILCVIWNYLDGMVCTIIVACSLNRLYRNFISDDKPLEFD